MAYKKQSFKKRATAPKRKKRVVKQSLISSLFLAKKGGKKILGIF